MPVTEPASLACAMSLLFLLLGDSVQVRARHCLALFTRGNPRAVLEVSLETAAVLTTRSLVGVPALQVRLLGVGRVGRGAVTWGGERGVGIPGEGGEDGGQPQLEAGESRGGGGWRPGEPPEAHNSHAACGRCC